MRESQRSDFAEVGSAGGYDLDIFNISAEKQKQLRVNKDQICKNDPNRAR